MTETNLPETNSGFAASNAVTLSTNGAPNKAAAAIPHRPAFYDLSTREEGVQIFALLVCMVLGYSLMLWLGRWLKRKHGVQLRWPYHLFSICLATWGPAMVLHIYFPFRRELGALTCILAAGFVITL